MTALSEKAQSMIDAARESRAVSAPPSSGRVFPAYSPQLMVDLMVENPSWTHGQFALYFGRQPSWISSVLASESFQQALDPRRHEVADPSLTATMEERFRGLALRAVTVLGEKLNATDVSDLVVLKAAEIGVKALGLGQKPSEVAALPSPTNSSEDVASKLLRAMDERDKLRTVDVEMAEVVEVRGGK